MKLATMTAPIARDSLFVLYNGPKSGCSAVRVQLGVPFRRGVLDDRKDVCREEHYRRGFDEEGRGERGAADEVSDRGGATIAATPLPAQIPKSCGGLQTSG